MKVTDVVQIQSHHLYDQRGVYTCADTAELTECLTQMKKAQEIYATWTQEKVDELCCSVSRFMEGYYLQLANMAYNETHVGNEADKLIKNIYAGSVVFESYKDMKTCDEISFDTKNGVRKYASPMGIVAAFVPFTNPTATTIYKSMLVLKSRNAVLFSPTPNCQNSAYETCAILSEAVKAAGGPPGLFGIIRNAREKLTQTLMKHPMIDIIFATGGKGMVTHAYSSGKPSLGVGSGNVPVIIEEAADLPEALAFIKRSKTFDYGVLCSSEEVLLVQESIYDEVKEYMRQDENGFYLVEDPEDVEKLRKTFRNEKGIPNMKVIGKPATVVASEAGVTVPSWTNVVVAERPDAYNPQDSWLLEKMSPGLALVKFKDMDDAFAQAKTILSYNGLGHSAIIHTNQWLKEKQHLLERAGIELPVGRVTVNQPGCFGTIGGLMNFGVGATMSIGCGSWGGNSTSDNIGPQHLVNFKTVAIGTEDARLARKAVNLFKPEVPMIRAAFEMFCTTLEYIASHRNLAPRPSIFDAAVQCCRQAWTFLDSISRDIQVISYVQKPLCQALEEYQENRFHKEPSLCLDLRNFSRTINISTGYFLFIVFPYLMRHGSETSWAGLDDVVQAEFGSDVEGIVASMRRIGVPLHDRDDALPDINAKHFGLESSRYHRLRKYKKPKHLQVCWSEMMAHDSTLDAAEMRSPLSRQSTNQDVVTSICRMARQRSLMTNGIVQIGEAQSESAKPLLEQDATLRTTHHSEDVGAC